VSTYHRHTRAFLAFHAANPHVYDVLVKYTRQAKASGLSKVGLSTLIGRARWYLQVETTQPDGFRINDHTGPYYARLIMTREDDLDGMFDLHDSLADFYFDSWIGEAA